MEELLEEQLHESENLDITRYIKAILRKWWLILAIFLAGTLPWLYHLNQQPPVYESEVWISFDNTGQIQESMIQSRIMKLQSRTFAEEVVAELGLAMELITPKGETQLLRGDIFRFVSTSKTPVTGSYELKFYPSGNCAVYHEGQRLDSLTTYALIEDTVGFNGIQFRIKPNAPNERASVAFIVNNFNSTVKSLRARERINNSTAGDLMQIILTDKDPLLATQTVNMLADIFIRKSMDLYRENVEFQSQFLKEQMDVVMDELKKTDEQWESLRGTYLQGIPEEIKAAVTLLNTLDAQKEQLLQDKEQLEMLLNRLDPTSDISSSYIYQLLTTQPVFATDNTMGAMKMELEDLIDRRTRMLEGSLTRVHPEVTDVNDNIALLENKIHTHSEKKVKELEVDIETMQARIDAEQATLNRLPREEKKQINLGRERTALEDKHNLLFSRYNDAKITEAVPVENVHIIDYAVPPDTPVSANKQKKAAMGAAIALMLGLGVVLVMAVADKRIRSRDDIKRYLRMPLLGIIPKVKFNDYELQDAEKAKSISSQIVTHDYSPTPVGEAYRSLRTNILFSKNFGPVKSMAIGSVAPGEGKSFTATNLAITLAQQKSKTLLIDADLRRGVLHNTFNCPKKPGLTNYLTGVAPLDQVMNETYIPNLTLITCGSMIPNPSEVLGSVRMKRFIEGISSRFDFIIFDTPPLMAATDAIILATLVDGIAVLLRAGETNRDDVQKKLELFQNVDVNVMGAILNCAGADVAHDGYSYYRY